MRVRLLNERRSAGTKDACAGGSAERAKLQEGPAKVEEREVEDKEGQSEARAEWYA